VLPRGKDGQEDEVGSSASVCCIGRAGQRGVARVAREAG
jgi:hypothetical protein